MRSAGIHSTIPVILSLKKKEKKKKVFQAKVLLASE